MGQLYYLFSNSHWLKIAIGCLFIILCIFLINHLFKKEDIPQPHTISYPNLPFLKPSPAKLKTTRKERMGVALLTCVYAFISFYQLGSMEMPVTTWQPQVALQEIIFELPENRQINEIYGIYGEGDNNSKESGYQLGFDHTKFYGSNDLDEWTYLTEFANSSIYRYQRLKGNWNYKYIKMISGSIHDTVTEIAFKNDESNSFLPIKIFKDEYSDSLYPAELMIDEQSLVPLYPTYMDESYFDEVYHPRNAWEIANKQFMYPHVHPLFGTSLIALSIKCFGMNPFAWRLPGVLFGILMVPLFYSILKLLFYNARYAFIGTLLFCTDFMHIVTSRIGTLEPFSVFFILWMFYYMIKYLKTSFYDTPLNETLFLLLKCGIVMGIGFATKWTVCYSAVGLAILFFTSIYIRYQEYKKVKKIQQNEEILQNLSKEEQELCSHIMNSAIPYIWKTIAWCFLFFIGIPFIIYFLAYLPCPVWKDGYSISNVFKQISYMYHYHINLSATHPYQSEWYQWLFDVRPIWYYGRELPNGLYQSIACFSNPITCWVGAIAIIYTIVDVFKHKSLNAWVIAIGYLTAFLPWVSLVERCVFAYHFYPTSLFMIMAITYVIKKLDDKKHSYIFSTSLAILSTIVFFMFLPVLLGFEVSSSYIKFLEWFPSWYFG